MRRARASTLRVYTDLIISTIVDEGLRPLRSCFGLYGLDNFYYRRLYVNKPKNAIVYTDLIISTIVDLTLPTARCCRLYGLDNFYYRRLYMLTGVMK